MSSVTYHYQHCSTVDGGVLLDGHFDEYELSFTMQLNVRSHITESISSLKSVSYIRVLSTGNISCPALGAAFASLTFTAKKYDLYKGFTCWTGYENNSWDYVRPCTQSDDRAILPYLDWLRVECSNKYEVRLMNS